MPTLANNIGGLCRFCGAHGVQTVDSRPGDRPGWRRRRRRCMACDKRWTSMELPIEDIEKILEITQKLNKLSDIAADVHNTIEALREPRVEDIGTIAPSVPTGRELVQDGAKELTLQELELR